MELKHLIEKGPSDDLVVEISAENQLKIAQHISALANSTGGHLIIGVNNKFKIKGCEPSFEFSNLNSAIEDFLSNEIDLQTEIIQDGPKLLLIVTVKKSKKELVTITSDLGKDQVYIRKEYHTILANKIIEQVLRLQLHDAAIVNEDSYVKQEVEELLTDKQYSLSQIYTLIEFEKKLIDMTLVQMLFFEEIDYKIKDEVIQFCIKN